MIQLQFENLDTLWEAMNDKVVGIEEIISSKSKTQIAKAVFTITSKRFILDFSKAAAASPKKYFHMFEWEEVGNPDQKLFKVKREKVANGNMMIRLDYSKSRKPVPIDPELLKSGKNGKSVTKRSIFANKAEVMESGRPVSFTTKQYIVFMSSRTNKPVFLAPGTFVTIKSPGGQKTTGSFDKFAEAWYASKVDSAVRRSGMFKSMEKAIVKQMNQSNYSAPKVREVIRVITEQYAQGVVEL